MLDSQTALRRGTIPMMTLACGVMLANVYICQPLLDEMARSFGVAEHAAGLVAVAAQVGYALGLLFVLPLADVADPRRLVRWMMAVAAVGMFTAAIAPSLPVLVAAGIVVAAASSVPQMLVPLATALVPPQRRGRVIGALQIGMVLGILLSRTVSGAVATLAGSWRAPYLLGGGLTVALFLLLPGFMPPRDPHQERRSYFGLLRSLPPLLALRPLRVSIVLGFCTFGAFSAFWATLAFHLASPAFGLGAAATGLFGLWGAPGALLAPLGGRMSDRFGPASVNIAALGCAGLSFVISGMVGGVSLLALVVAVNLLDFGLQAGQVANQARVFQLGDETRARLNTLYMVGVFSGGAAGSLAGTMAWSYAGWTGVCVFAGCLILVAATVLAFADRRAA